MFNTTLYLDLDLLNSDPSNLGATEGLITESDHLLMQGMTKLLLSV